MERQIVTMESNIVSTYFESYIDLQKNEETIICTRDDIPEDYIAYLKEMTESIKHV
jgi:hypothetical protein